MPRFNPNNYDPGKESSSEHARAARKEGAVILSVAQRADGTPGCPCGCEGIPGEGSTFMMGHDARYRGKLIRAHLTDTPVVLVCPGGARNKASAMSRATDLDWERYLDAAEARREGKNREVLAKAVGSKRLIQVGRWQYTGQVLAIYDTDEGTDYDVEYVTKTGEKKTARVPARKTSPAPKE